MKTCRCLPCRAIDRALRLEELLEQRERDYAAREDYRAARRVHADRWERLDLVLELLNKCEGRRGTSH